MNSGVVLAGGKSTRMGLDKCKLEFCGKPLIFWPYSVLGNLVDEMIISISKDGDPDSLKSCLGKRIIIARDEKSNLGPISGLFAAFNKARGEYVAVTPCDSPLIKPELYLRLFELAKETDGAVPEVKGYLEPLHGVYKRDAMLRAIEISLASGKNRPRDAYEHLNIIKLHEKEIKSIDSELVSFLNINSSSDLAAASSMFIRIRNENNR